MRERRDTMIEEKECVDPEMGSAYLDGYIMDTLTPAQRQSHEDHLYFCSYCQEEQDYRRLLLRALQQQPLAPAAENAPLPITAIVDDASQDFLPAYHYQPLAEPLAAASGATSGEIAFPLNAHYAGGDLIGAFWRRAGQLFFRLTAVAPARGCSCVLRYTPAADTQHVVQWQLSDGEEIRLGPFCDFAAVDSARGMIDALRCFSLFERAVKSMFTP